MPDQQQADWTASPGTAGQQQSDGSSSPGTVGAQESTQPAAVAATGTLTFGSAVSSAGSVVIGAKSITFATTFPQMPPGIIDTSSPLTAEAAAAALAALINGGEDYYGMVGTYEVLASVSGAVVTVTAKTPGTAGNSLASTTTVSGASWGAGTLAGGIDAPGTPGTIGQQQSDGSTAPGTVGAIA